MGKLEFHVPTDAFWFWPELLHPMVELELHDECDEPIEETVVFCPVYVHRGTIGLWTRIPWRVCRTSDWFQDRLVYASGARAEQDLVICTLIASGGTCTQYEAWIRWSDAEHATQENLVALLKNNPKLPEGSRVSPGPALWMVTVRHRSARIGLVLSKGLSGRSIRNFVGICWPKKSAGNRSTQRLRDAVRAAVEQSLDRRPSQGCDRSIEPTASGLNLMDFAEECLESQIPFVRGWALDCWGQNSSNSVALLAAIDAGITDHHPYVRETACSLVELLAAEGSSCMAPILDRVQNSVEWFQRAWAIRIALHDNLEHAWTQALLRRHDLDERVSVEATYTLAELRPRDAPTHLRPMLEDSRMDVRSAAAHCLLRLGGEDDLLMHMVDSLRNGSRIARVCLRGLGVRASSWLLRSLESHPDDNIRVGCAEAIGEIVADCTDAPHALKKATADRSKSVRWVAKAVLNRIRK